MSKDKAIPLMSSGESLIPEIEKHFRFIEWGGEAGALNKRYCSTASEYITSQSQQTLQQALPAISEIIAKPTSNSIRSLLQNLISTDSELDAFCLDFFESVYREFSNGMDRTQKLNLLISKTDRTEIFTAIKRRFGSIIEKYINVLEFGGQIIKKDTVESVASFSLTSLSKRPKNCP